MDVTTKDFLWAVVVVAAGIGMAVAGVLIVAQYADRLAQQLNAL